jgi:hypothetical protein
MRRLLKSLRTRNYFGQGHWTTDPAQAQHFPDSAQAIDVCLRHHLDEVELVLQLGTEPREGLDTHLRLFDRHARA